MARPVKKGLDYFNIDINQEDNLTLVEAKHGVEGYGLVVKLWRKIYQIDGYFCKWDEKNILLFAKEVGMPADAVKLIVNTCFEEEIFNLEMYLNHKILTSSGVQKRWKKIVTEAKRKGCKIEGKYSLLKLIPEKKGFLPGKLGFPPEETTQRKGTKLTGNEIKGNIPAPSAPVIPISKPKKDKNKEAPEEHWEKIVDTWFDFNTENFGDKPSFAGQDPRHLKNIFKILKRRAIEKKIEWTEKVAASRFREFLLRAYEDPWLRTNFLLSNLEKFIDKIILNQIKNGQTDHKKHTSTSNFGGFAILDKAIKQAGTNAGNG